MEEAHYRVLIQAWDFLDGSNWVAKMDSGVTRAARTVAVLSEEENRGRLALFAGIDGVRFKRIVEPGDELELTCDLEKVRGPIGKGRAEARVDGELAARGTLTFAVEQS